jgi:hypothetical protein
MKPGRDRQTVVEDPPFCARFSLELLVRLAARAGLGPKLKLVA